MNRRDYKKLMNVKKKNKNYAKLTILATLGLGVALANSTTVKAESRDWTPNTSTTIKQGDKQYTIKWGDYLALISKDSGVTIETLMKLNDSILDADLIYEGNVIYFGDGVNAIVKDAQGNVIATTPLTEADKQGIKQADAQKVNRASKTENKKNISAVEENNGVIHSQLSPKIKVSDYLKLYEKDIGIKFSKSNVLLSEVNHSVYIIQVEKSNTKYKFKVDSEYLLTKHHEKMKFIFPENFKNDIDMFDINDTQTKDRLFLNGQKYLLVEKNAELKDINVGRIVSMYDNDLTSEEYTEAQQKVIRIISNLLVLSKSNTKNLEIFVNKDVVNIGKLVLFDIESSIEYESTNMSEKDFYEYIVSQLN